MKQRVASALAFVFLMQQIFFFFVGYADTVYSKTIKVSANKGQYAGKIAIAPAGETECTIRNITQNAEAIAMHKCTVELGVTKVWFLLKEKYPYEVPITFQYHYNSDYPTNCNFKSLVVIAAQNGAFTFKVGKPVDIFSQIQAECNWTIKYRVLNPNSFFYQNKEMESDWIQQPVYDHGKMGWFVPDMVGQWTLTAVAELRNTAGEIVVKKESEPFTISVESAEQTVPVTSNVTSTNSNQSAGTANKIRKKSVIIPAGLSQKAIVISGIPNNATECTINSITSNQHIVADKRCIVENGKAKLWFLLKESFPYEVTLDYTYSYNHEYQVDCPIDAFQVVASLSNQPGASLNQQVPIYTQLSSSDCKWQVKFRIFNPNQMLYKNELLTAEQDLNQKGLFYRITGFVPDIPGDWSIQAVAELTDGDRYVYVTKESAIQTYAILAAPTPAPSLKPTNNSQDSIESKVLKLYKEKMKQAKTNGQVVTPAPELNNQSTTNQSEIIVLSDYKDFVFSSGLSGPKLPPGQFHILRASQTKTIPITVWAKAKNNSGQEVNVTSAFQFVSENQSIADLVNSNQIKLNEIGFTNIKVTPKNAAYAKSNSYKIPVDYCKTECANRYEIA